MRMKEAMAALGASQVTDISMLTSSPADTRGGGSTALRPRPDAGSEPRPRQG